ncbi:MAG: ABC transporter permease subunit [Chloroflexi bacterium]|nr:ABC transporter permease subunit [Chloroflexota bacterium]
MSGRSLRLPFDPLGGLGLVGLFGVWYAITWFHWLPVVYLPAPDVVARTIWDNLFASRYLENFHLGRGGLLAALSYTVQNVALALLLACTLGISLGLASTRVRSARAVLDPIVLTLGTIPILVTAPFFLIWFGTDRSGQIALLVVYESTLIYMFAQRAVANLDPVYEAAARTMGATPRHILLDVHLKGTLPEVFGGIRIALAGAWGLEAVSELLGAPNGMGKVISALASSTDVPTIMATVLVLAAVAVAVDILVAGLIGYFTRWRPEVAHG